MSDCNNCGEPCPQCESHWSGIVESIKAERDRYKLALEKIAKDGCVAVTIRGEWRDVLCVQTAKQALSEGNLGGSRIGLNSPEQGERE